MQKFLSVYRPLVIQTVSYLYILLFVYAAVSKLLKFEDFKTQLGQSPVFDGIAVWTAYGVVISELLISVLLSFDRTRKIGLVFALNLMIMFTTYIIIILNFAAFTPCSCGGIIESLGWTEHLIFNIAFIVLALLALYSGLAPEPLKYLVYICAMVTLSVGSVVIAYLWSDRQIERNNAFIRRYIPHGLEKLGEYALGSNTCYIAGIDDHTIYLGDYNAPLFLRLLDSGLKYESKVHIDIDNTDLPYKRVRIKVKSPYFFLGDGTIPIAFKGSIKDWKGKRFSYDDAYFIQFMVHDSLNLAIATTITKTNTNALGLLFKQNDSVHLLLNKTILVKQLNGTFDTDGILLDNERGRIGYVYHYRNAFEIANDKLRYEYTGKTIDTLSRVQLDIGRYKGNQYKLGGKSVIVNKNAAMFGDFLYIHTDRLGKYEDAEVLRSASIIDMYNINKNIYLKSFYFYHQFHGRLTELQVYKDRIIAIVDDRLWIYRIKPEYYN